MTMESDKPNVPAQLPTIQFNSSLDLYLNTDKMNQLYKVATMFAESDIVPKQFQGKKGNCFIALEMASNMGVSPIFLMQNLSIVNGKPAIEAKLLTAMVNNSGRFVDPLEYEIVGTDPTWNKEKGKPSDPTYKVRCFAVLKKTGKTLLGPWITWDMVMLEKWHDKTGSKWLSLPEMMFMYRAASFFSKQYCSDLSFGMQTQDEAGDILDITPGSPTQGQMVKGGKSKAASILNAFDDPAPATAASETATGDPVEASTETDSSNADPGTGETDMTPEEEEAIRQQEIKEAQDQENLFK